MASLNLSEAEFKSLQLTAQRLRSINGDIESMKSNIFQSNQPLPSLYVLLCFHDPILYSYSHFKLFVAY